MTMIPTCVVCDSRVANIYAPGSRCERCKLPCPTCGGDVAFCQHKLPDAAAEYAEQLVEVEHLGPGRIAA